MEQEPQEPKEARAAEAARAFEFWLQRSLHRLYDDVTREPVPPELLRLIEQARSRRAG
jgi:hypothetical protein